MFRSRTQILLGAPLAMLGLVMFASNPAHAQLTLPYAQSATSSLPAFAISNVGGNGIAGQSDVGVGMNGISGFVGVAGFSSSTNGGSGVLGNGNYIGVYGKGPVGVAGVGTTYAGLFQGTVIATNYLTNSDARFKTNIATLPNALERVLAMRGVSFDWRRNEFPDKNFKKGPQFGFIAQEMEKACPELVSKDQKGYRAVDYTAVVPVLVEAIKAQQQRINTLEKQVASVNAQQTHAEAHSARAGNTNQMALPLLAATILVGFGVGRLRRR